MTKFLYPTMVVRQSLCEQGVHRDHAPFKKQSSEHGLRSGDFTFIHIRAALKERQPNPVTTAEQRWTSPGSACP